MELDFEKSLYRSSDMGFFWILMEVLAVRGGWDGAGLAGAGGVVGDEVCWESGCEGVGAEGGE